LAQLNWPEFHPIAGLVSLTALLACMAMSRNIIAGLRA
jgi:hypothetical protein